MLNSRISNIPKNTRTKAKMWNTIRQSHKCDGSLVHWM